MSMGNGWNLKVGRGMQLEVVTLAGAGLWGEATRGR
jgi:hypothetical protein